MLTAQRLTASAVGARTARACDGCMLRRARWFCASDDAFLCHACDTSVHSANQLASRHERVRISSASSAAALAVVGDNQSPDWHRKVTRKARTPRKTKSELANSLIVPDIGAEEETGNEDLLVYEVPVFDADCGFWNENESASVEELHNLLDFVPDDVQFMGLDGVDFLCNDSELEMLDWKKKHKLDFSLEAERNKRVKIEDVGEAELACQVDLEVSNLDESRESLLDWDFEFDESDEMGVKEEEDIKLMGRTGQGEGFGKRMLLLNLDCEQVMSAWDEQCCPWTTGVRPELDPLGDGWPQFLGCDTNGRSRPEDETGGGLSKGQIGNEERMARVKRYREKRRTRLFSKKIRYEVRKLNAEKRPRMKGRFVKRALTFVGPQTSYLKQ